MYRTSICNSTDAFCQCRGIWKAQGGGGGGFEPLGETGYGRLHIIHTRRHSGVMGIPVAILKGKVCQNILADF